MNAEKKKLWVDALRSGEYKQGNRYLCANDKYCCLGVLCELAIKNGVSVVRRDERDDDVGSIKMYGSKSNYPPVEVLIWAGLEYRSGEISRQETISSLGREVMILAKMNDDNHSFTQIAEYINKNL